MFQVTENEGAIFFKNWDSPGHAVHEQIWADSKKIV